MRTPRLRAVAVVAGFAGVSMLVAGTASAMVSGQTDAPIANAVTLHQADPRSETAPVPAAMNLSSPIEVGMGPIKCDESGDCTTSITVEANAPEPPPESERLTPSTRQVQAGTPSTSTSETPAGGSSKPRGTDSATPGRAPSNERPSGAGHNSGNHRQDQPDKGHNPREDNATPKRGSNNQWSPPHWDFERHNSWNDGWHEGWRGEWQPGQWSGDHWREGWGKRHR